MKKLWFSLAKKDRVKIMLTALVVALLLTFSLIPLPEKIYVGVNYMIPTSESNGIGVVYPFSTPAYRLEYSVTSAEQRARIESIYYTEVTRVHQRLDRHSNYFVDDAIGISSGLISNIRLLNQSYGNSAGIPFDQLLWDYLEMGMAYTRLTNGSFHIAIGAISEFWSEVLISPSLTDETMDPSNNPQRRELLETLVACLPTPLELTDLIVHNEDEDTIVFHPFYSSTLGRYCTSSEIELSFGGLGKGIANDMLQARLMDYNYKQGLIYGGGSSITTLYNRSFVNPWTIEIPYPFLYGDDFKAQEAFVLSSTEAFSISQSGGYEGGFVEYYNETSQEWEREWRHHIIDPQSGYPLNHHHAVVVYSKTALSSGLLDALSTALLNLPIDQGLAILATVAFPVEVVYVLQTSRTSATVHATSGIIKQLRVGPGVTLIEI